MLAIGVRWLRFLVPKGIVPYPRGGGGWGVSPDLSHLEPNPENLSHLRVSKDFYWKPVRSDAERLRDKSERPEHEKLEQPIRNDSGILFSKGKSAILSNNVDFFACGASVIR